MPLIVFDDSLKLGIDVIDEQHEQLIQQINDTHDALEAGMDGSEFISIVNKLMDYCVYHFSEEEALMRQYCYPAYQSHKAEHNTSTEEFFNFDTSEVLRNPESARKLLDFLHQWLLNHIDKVDRSLALYLKEEGLNPSARAAHLQSADD